ncbi:unnamed protein product [Effrenium voratum]|nr:unnamed protein product [Effrenium voratum]
MGIVEQMNCTARNFVNLILESVTEHLRLSGAAPAETELSYHFDPGHSGGEPAEGEEARCGQTFSVHSLATLWEVF